MVAGAQRQEARYKIRHFPVKSPVSQQQRISGQNGVLDFPEMNCAVTVVTTRNKILLRICTELRARLKMVDVELPLVPQI
jgi:hypothetical protein